MGALLRVKVPSQVGHNERSEAQLDEGVRVIAATHRDLKQMVEDGEFRSDLFYRLNVFPIEIPPLRERREDIPMLLNYFVSKSSRRMGKQINSIPDHAMELLTGNDWRGSVRELANAHPPFRRDRRL